MHSLAHGVVWLVCLLAAPGADQAPNFRIKPELPGIVRQTAQPPTQAPAPPPAAKVKTPGREFFISWGYNGDNYTKSDLHISQPSIDSDFTFAGVQAHDSKGWTSLFSHGPTVPQYNVRLGYFMNEKWGLELALDHIKWIVTQDQTVRMSGTVNGSPVDTDVVLTTDVLKYQLNNGANPIFFNLIRRMTLAGKWGHTGHIALLLKGGGGFAVPHTENALFGQPNEAGFQWFAGWNVDAGAAVRAHVWRGVYVEFEDKFVYARYFDVNVDRGTARHGVTANEFSFHFGLSFR